MIEKINEAVEYLKQQGIDTPQIGVILGIEVCLNTIHNTWF